MIEWKEDAGIDGWTGDLGEEWVLEITPHAKDGWSWTVITDDADQKVPEGWDPTLKDAMVHSERAYVGWLDGREEHDETAEIVADAVAQERAAVVAFLREQANQWDRDAAGWAALNHASVMIERGEHRREEGA